MTARLKKDTSKALNARDQKSYKFAPITDLTRIAEFDAWDKENNHARKVANGKVLFEEIRAIQKAIGSSPNDDENERSQISDNEFFNKIRAIQKAIGCDQNVGEQGSKEGVCDDSKS